MCISLATLAVQCYGAFLWFDIGITSANVLSVIKLKFLVGKAKHDDRIKAKTDYIIPKNISRKRLFLFELGRSHTGN